MTVNIEVSAWFSRRVHDARHIRGPYGANASMASPELAEAIKPFWLQSVDLASANAWRGKDDKARAAVLKLFGVTPNYTVYRFANERWSDNPVFLTQYRRIVEGLRKAGLPEK